MFLSTTFGGPGKFMMPLMSVASSSSPRCAASSCERPKPDSGVDAVMAAVPNSPFCAGGTISPPPVSSRALAP
jgi:hypothetical protein